MNDCHDKSRTISKTKDGTPFRLDFIEFDDQGVIQRRDYKNSILKEYTEMARDDDLLLVIFVHGWHHNSQGKPEDSNIIGFRKILAAAAENITDKKVVGVYLGWRGDSVRTPLLDSKNIVNVFTFWDRKNTAHEIGTQGMTNILLELESTISSSKDREHRLISIGHSFGGAALFSAIEPILASRFVDSRSVNSNSTIRGFGDLVVLLNPAFESIKYSGLFELSQNDCKPYSQEQKPKLVILSSSADSAVGWAFPTGRRWNALLETHRNTSVIHCTPDGRREVEIDESYTDRYAVGHNKVFLSHDLNSTENRNIKSKYISNESFQGLSDGWIGNPSAEIIDFGSSILKSREITTPHNPYLNIWTDGKIMNGHNDIWTFQVQNFIYQFIGLAAK
jgi:hypothetical protein